MIAFDKPDNPYEKTNDTTYNDADDKRTKIKCSAVFAEGEKRSREEHKCRMEGMNNA